MTNPVALVAPFTHNGRDVGRGIWLWCPGCDEAHRPMVAGVAGDLPEGPCWQWNGDPDSLTISPSLLVCGGDRGYTCHSFVRAGQWQFLPDSTHALAGQTVPLVPLPDWLVR